MKNLTAGARPLGGPWAVPSRFRGRRVIRRAESREYYVLETWASGAPSVHSAACPSCADGALTAGGKWHGPFADKERAAKLAGKLGVAAECRDCGT
jgi:hypothetical protein